MSFKNDPNAKRRQAFDYDYAIWIFAATAVLVVAALGVWVARGPNLRSAASATTGPAVQDSSKNGNMSVRAQAGTRSSETTGEATSPSGGMKTDTTRPK